MARVGGDSIKLCYSRPSANGRVVFGGIVPWDTLWRTGANEPTILHLSAAAEVATIPVAAGRYSVYTVPGEDAWTGVINASTSQWGLTQDVFAEDGSLSFTNAYTTQVRGAEVGRAPLVTERLPFTEQLTFSLAPSDDEGADLLIDWADERVRISIRFTSPGS